MAREIVTQILTTYAAMADGELEPALRLLSDDFICDETHALPDGKVYRGRDGFIAWAEEVGERWHELDFAIDDVSDLGNAVVVSAHVELRGRMSGATVRQRFAQVFELQGDRVARLTTFPTVETALSALRATLEAATLTHGPPASIRASSGTRLSCPWYTPPC